MRNQKFLALATAALWVAGCASPDANPPAANAHAGYVDFHADEPDELNWEVARFDERSQKFQRLYLKLEAPPNDVLRLTLAPGAHRLRIWIVNRVVIEPAVIQVEVKAGRVTPVRIVFHAEGTALVQRTEEQRGATVKGGSRRRVSHSSDEAPKYRLSAEAGTSVPYQVRERMSYARSKTNPP